MHTCAKAERKSYARLCVSLPSMSSICECDTLQSIARSAAGSKFLQANTKAGTTTLTCTLAKPQTRKNCPQVYRGQFYVCVRASAVIPALVADICSSFCQAQKIWAWPRGQLVPKAANQSNPPKAFGEEHLWIRRKRLPISIISVRGFGSSDSRIKLNAACKQICYTHKHRQTHSE